MNEPSITSELVEIKNTLREILMRLNTTLPIEPTPRASTAAQARIDAQALGYYTTKLFAETIGRHRNWVAARCKARVIRTLPGGKPWRIPLQEEREWIEGRTP